MRKCVRMLAAVLCAASLLQTVPAGAVDASPTTNPIYVDGQLVELDSYTINGYTYYKIRDLAEVLDFEVGYDTSTDSVLMWNSTQRPPDGSGQQDPSQPAFSPDERIPDQPGDPAPGEDGPLAEWDPANPGATRDVVDGRLVVLLDPGHSGSDVGTTSVDEKYFERDFNIDVAVRVKSMLEASGVEVLMTREPEETERIWPSERVKRIDKLVKEHPVDVLVSIHHNATELHKATGSEILVQVAYEKGGPGQELARCIEAEYRALGRSIRPTKYQRSEKDENLDYQYLLLAAQERDLLAVMSEYCFIDTEELQLVLTEEGRDREAAALTAAILKYFAGHPY